MNALPEYSSFAALLRHHVEGRDFTRVIEVRNGARVAVVAPHGGKIEPRTDSIAKALAGEEFSLYCFSALLPRSKANLHITSHRFDDPDCLKVVEQCKSVVAVHGWARAGEGILIGGLDTKLGAGLAAIARSLKIETHTDAQGLLGTDPKNICNRSKSGRGVQLEMTMALRKSPKLGPLLEAYRAVLAKQ